MKKFEIGEEVRNNIILALEMAIHPSVQMKDLLLLRQMLMTLPEVKKNADSTDPADSKAAC